MRNFHRVVWSKGMFLTPQHFQAQDAYLEDFIHARFEASHFANWGVTDLAIDEPSLANGFFTVRHCQGVLADGLPFKIPEMDDLPAGRPVEDFFPPTQEALDVYLAVPQRREGGKNFVLLSGKETPENGSHVGARYFSEIRMTLDENLGAEEKPVQVARKNFSLRFGGENLNGFTSLRIAQIIRSQSGAYVLNPQFIAPCLTISSSDYLMMLLRRQIEVMAAKSSSLLLARREKGRGVADFSTSEISDYWLLHTVNSFLPELKHIWKIRRIHPERPFAALLRLAGALSTFSLDADAREFPDYDHADLGYCFTELDNKIRSLLEKVRPSKYVPVPLQLADKLIWSGTIADDQYFKNSQFFLAVSARMGIDELISKFPKRATISSSGEIQRLIRNALPGLKLRHEPAPPAAIPLKLDNQYFRLNQTGALWEAITQSRNISLFVSSEIVDPKMELYVVLE